MGHEIKTIEIDLQDSLIVAVKDNGKVIANSMLTPSTVHYDRIKGYTIGFDIENYVAHTITDITVKPKKK